LPMSLSKLLTPAVLNILKLTLPVLLFTGVVATALKYIGTKEQIYTSSARLWMQAKITSFAQEQGLGAYLPLMAFYHSPINTAAELMKSEKVIAEAITLLKIRLPEEKIPPAGQIASGISAVPKKETDILQVSYSDADPQKAQMVLEAVLDGFVKLNSSQSASNATESRKFLEHQLKQAYLKLMASRNKMAEFQRKHNLPDVPTQVSTLVGQIAGSESEINGLKIERLKHENLMSYLEGQMGTALEGSDGSSISTAFLVDSLRQRLLTLQLQYASLSSKLKESHPLMKRLKLLVEETRKELANHSSDSPQLPAVTLTPSLLPSAYGSARSAGSLTSAGPLLPASLFTGPNGRSAQMAGWPGIPRGYGGTPNPAGMRNSLPGLPTLTGLAVPPSPVIASLASRGTMMSGMSPSDPTLLSSALEQARMNQIGLQTELDAHQAVLESAKEQLLNMPDLQAQFADLMREVDLAQGAVADFEQRLYAAGLLEAVAASTSHIQIVDNPNLPGGQPQSKMELAQVLAVVLGLVLGAGSYFGIEFLNPRIRSAKAALQLLPLPAAGYIKLSKDIDDSDNELAMSRLRLALKPAVDDGRRRIIISSPGAGDGKSSVALGLAWSMANSGKKVCLIDTDFAAPTLHESLSVKRSPGLAELLSQEAVQEEGLVLSIDERLGFLPGGARDLPEGALESQKFRNLVSKLEEEFDVLIFDTRPVMQSAGALALLEDTCLLVVVVRLKHTMREALQFLATQLAGQRHIEGAVVLADADEQAVASTAAGPGKEKAQAEEEESIW